MGLGEICSRTTLEVGWPPEYVKNNPEPVERFLKSRMSNLPTLEDYLRHSIVRQACDSRARLHQANNRPWSSSATRIITRAPAIRSGSNRN